MCVYVQVVVEAERSHPVPGGWLWWGLEQNLGSLQEQYTSFATEPLLHPQEGSFRSWKRHMQRILLWSRYKYMKVSERTVCRWFIMRAWVRVAGPGRLIARDEKTVSRRHKVAFRWIH